MNLLRSLGRVLRFTWPVPWFVAGITLVLWLIL